MAARERKKSNIFPTSCSLRWSKISSLYSHFYLFLGSLSLSLSLCRSIRESSLALLPRIYVKHKVKASSPWKKLFLEIVKGDGKSKNKFVLFDKLGKTFFVLTRRINLFVNCCSAGCCISGTLLVRQPLHQWQGRLGVDATKSSMLHILSMHVAGFK